MSSCVIGFRTWPFRVGGLVPWGLGVNVFWDLGVHEFGTVQGVGGVDMQVSDIGVGVRCFLRFGGTCIWGAVLGWGCRNAGW